MPLEDWKDAVFYLQAGATLKNVIIGKDQAEGVHCNGPCTLEFVWFEDVCEDAISVECSPWQQQQQQQRFTVLIKL